MTTIDYAGDVTSRTRAIQLNLDGIGADVDALVDQLEQDGQDLLGLQNDLTEATTRADAAEAEVARLKATHAPAMVLGGCPAKPNTGFTARAAQIVVDRFGDGAGVRLFGGKITTPSPRPEKAGAVTSTWDFGDDITALPTVPQLTKAGAALKPGDRWGRNHEADAKVRGKKYTLAQADTALVDFAEKAHEARSDLLTVIVFTGWLFSPAKTAPGLAARNAWGPTSSHYDVVGADFDGIHGFPYADYRKHLDNILAFLDKFGIEWFEVPELGWPRDVKNDPTGSKRMDLAGLIVEACRATGRCLGAEAYLYESTPGNDFNADETARWQAFRAATA